VIGRKLPGFAPAAPPTRASDPDSAKARLDRPFMTLGQTGQLGSALRTVRRHLIGFLLGYFLGHCALQIPRPMRNLFLDMSQGLVRGANTPV
jgi:hypothetical protein